ncbi:MAG: hypothetical protein SVR81_09095 [Chloroflexota bacterium]|nr:hypothetical protein [Chloroflexota bacterium]
MTDTLLDYEVFDRLRAHLGDANGEVEAAFSEWVLGYGFRVGQGADATATGGVFVLLCNTQDMISLQNAIDDGLPERSLTLAGHTIPVLVLDSLGPQSLVHSLSLPADTTTSPSDNNQATHQSLADWVQVSLGQTLRQVVLQENRKVILPAYLLRFTPFTSPNLILLWAALRQIHYLHQTGRSANDDFEQRTVTARMNEISRWCGFSRTTIYRLLHEDERSRWLIQVENRGAIQNDRGQHVSLPNQYRLEPLQLTPGDAADFAAYLATHQSDWPDLDAALVTLAKTEKRQVLTYPYRTPQPGDREAPTDILTLLREVFGSFALTAERLALLDKVRANLIGDDFVAVPWYLLRRLLPVYGASIVTLYLMSQPLLYRNGGVHRDTFWLPGGADAVVAWTDDRSVGKYFPKANAKGRGRPASGKGASDGAWRKNKRELLSDFFLRVKTQKDDQGETQWQIQVHDLPVLPADEALMASVYSRLADLIREQQLTPLINLLDAIEPQSAQPPTSALLDLIYRTPQTAEATQALTCLARGIISDYETPDEPRISNFETPVGRLISLFATSENGLFSKSATPAIALISEIETHLKILERIKDSIKKLINSTIQPDSGSQRESTKIDNPGRLDWDFNKILQITKPKYQQEILNDLAKQRAFKAWLIQDALSPRVQQPLNLAITQTLQDTAQPQAAAIRLMQMPPGALKALLESALRSPSGPGFSSDPDQRKRFADLKLLLMGQDPQTRAILLQRLLDLVDRLA